MSKQILIPVIAAVLAVSVSAFAASRSTKDGVFTSAQAERGKVVYDRSCKNCHMPEFYTEKLLRYTNQPMSALFETVSATMPADNVGSLPTNDYVDVLAYVLSINGAKPGKEELSEETMAGIAIAKPE